MSGIMQLTSNSISLGFWDLLLFVISILAWAWVVSTWKRGTLSRALKFVTVAITLLALVPFLLLGSAFLAARLDAPAAMKSASGLQNLPVNLGSSINTRLREAEPSFTADGRTMYFNCYDADICVSHLIGTWEEGNWTTPEKLGAPISTGYFEVEPLISADGDKLYFLSNRPAGRDKDNILLSPFVTN